MDEKEEQFKAHRTSCTSLHHALVLVCRKWMLLHKVEMKYLAVKTNFHLVKVILSYQINTFPHFSSFPLLCLIQIRQYLCDYKISGGIIKYCHHFVTRLLSYWLLLVFVALYIICCFVCIKYGKPNKEKMMEDATFFNLSKTLKC